MSRATHNQAPEISYDQAMKLYVGYYLPGGTPRICTVATCPSNVFYVLVQRAVRTATNTDEARRAVAHLHEHEYEGSFIDRWYAITELARLGATPFWSTSYVDARSNQVEHVS